MTSFMIARLSPHSKSLEAVEFIQRNGFIFRISSNSTFFNLLMSSEGVEERFATILGLSDEFKPGDEEKQLIQRLAAIEVKEEVDSDGAQRLKKNVDAAEVKEEVESDVEQDGVRATEEGDSIGRNHRLEMSPVAVQPVESVENFSPRNLLMIVEQTEDDVVDDHQKLREEEMNSFLNQVSENRQLGKEEFRITIPPEIKVEVDSNESPSPDERVIKEEEISESGQPDDRNRRLEMNSIGVQTEESVEVPLAAVKNLSPTVVMDVGQVEDESLSEIHEDLPSRVVEHGVQRVLSEPPLENVQMQAEEPEEQDSLDEKEGEGDEQRVEGVDEHYMTMDGPSEATDQDVSMIPHPPLHYDDGRTVNDVVFEEDLRITDVEAKDHKDGSDEDTEDDKKIEESDEEEELIEEQELELEGEKEDLVDEDGDGDGMDDEEELDSDEKKDSDTAVDESNEEDDEEAKDKQKKKEIQKKKRNQSSSNPVGRLLCTCPVKNCPSSFNTFNKLSGHMKTHSEVQEYFCDVCMKNFSSKEDAMAHVQERQKKKCCGCGKKFSSRSRLIVHLRTHSVEKPLVFQTCGRRSARRSISKKPTLARTSEKPYKCNHCEFKCSRPYNLEAHERGHTGERPYSCSQCEKRFIHKNLLTRHEMTHSGEKPFTCRHCGRRFNNGCSLKKHISDHFGQKAFSCKKCEAKFARNDLLMQHMKIKHKL